MDKKMTKEELVQLLKDNFTDEYGIIDISDLDFGDCEGVDTSGMKLKGYIYQIEHENNGNIYQYEHKNHGNIEQQNHINQGSVMQYNHENNGDVFQYDHENGGHIIQTDIEAGCVDIKSVKILTHLEIDKEELVTLIKNNFMDKYGVVDISDLDFGDCIEVNISRMKLKGHIKQYEHENNGNIVQDYHKNKGIVLQSYHKNDGDVWQHGHKNNGNVTQTDNKNIRNVMLLNKRKYRRKYGK